MVLRYVSGAMSASSYDVVCIIDCVQLTTLDLSSILRVLRPDGVMWILQLQAESDRESKSAADSIVCVLTLGGFVKPHAEVCC